METTKGEEKKIQSNGYTVVLETACDKARRLCNLKFARNQIYIKSFDYFYDVAPYMLQKIEEYAKNNGHDYIMGNLANHKHRDRFLLLQAGYQINKDCLDYFKEVIK